MAERTGALRLKVDRSRCCGCEACVAICPTGAIRLVGARAEITDGKCVCCGACVYECFYDAIAFEGGGKNENDNSEVTICGL